MNKPYLPEVTLIAIAGNKHGETIAALYKSLQQITPARTVLLTNIDITATGIECINVGGLDTWEAYNLFCIKELYKYFDTSHCLLVQWDGYILNGECWSDEFLDYDYIGAKWLDVGRPYNVGNGGFSLRSKWLQHYLGKDKNIVTTCPEDVSICKVYGQYLVDKYEIKFAPEEIADRFAYELNQPCQRTFGFHGFHWRPFQQTVVFKRSHALGDILQVEPVMHHFYKLGYQVALDTSDYFMRFFSTHYFPIIPRKHLNSKLPVIEIDLDMSYEVKPKQLHLKTYYEFAGIKDGELRNPKLSLTFDYRNKSNKLFEKYCILHIDERDQPHRNIYGVEWESVVKYLKASGYEVIQLGMGKSNSVKGAIKMATPSPEFLMWVVASSDMFIGIDSGISHIASGFDIPSVIFFGSVDPNVIHPDTSSKVIVHNHDSQPCKTPFCWGDVIGQSGKPCYVNEQHPPCTRFTTIQTLNAINQLETKKLISNIQEVKP